MRHLIYFFLLLPSLAAERVSVLVTHTRDASQAELRRPYRMVSKTNQIVVSITPAIGSATLQRQGGVWPDKLTLRLHREGMENLTLLVGDDTWSCGIASGGAIGGVLAAHASWNKTILKAGDPLFPLVNRVAATPPPLEGPRVGYFEVSVPDALLRGETIRLSWVDFYR